jgi:hypothetical protein
VEERSSLLVTFNILKILEVTETQQTFRLKLRLVLQWFDLRCAPHIFLLLDRAIRRNEKVWWNE